MTAGALPGDFPQHLIEHELGYGEKILWSGRPRQGIFLRMSDVPLIFGGLILSGFGFLGVVQEIERGKADVGFFLITGLGLYLMFGRFFVEAWQRSKIYYVATDQQAFIVYGLFGTKMRSLSFRDLYIIRLSLAWRGRGTITFGAPGFRRSSLGHTPNVVLFDSIEHAADVYELIRPHVPDE